MSSGCESGHLPIIDASTATIVCQECAMVLEEGLTYSEVKLQEFNTPFGSFNNESSEETINGENAYNVLEKIADKLHLCRSSIDNSYYEYKENMKKIRKILNFTKQYSKKKRLHLSNENVLIYSIYITLKADSCPRSIKEICYFSGGLKPLNVLRIGKFLEKSRDKTTPPKRLKPVTARDIILSHYPYIEGLSFDDVKQMNHKLNLIGLVNFTPTTTAAGIVYIYTNFVKHTKQTLQQISSLFQVTPMSIQRFMKIYKKFF